MNHPLAQLICLCTIACLVLSDVDVQPEVSTAHALDNNVTTTTAPNTSSTLNTHVKESVDASTTKSVDTTASLPAHHELANVSNCPAILAAFGCRCGLARFDLIDPAHLLYVTNCSFVNLTDVHALANMSNETEVLDLSHNSITSIDDPILQSHATLNDTIIDHNKLKVLDLSNNAITKLDARAFYGLKQLKYLDLSNNSLHITGEHYQPHLWKEQGELLHLRLHNAFADTDQTVNFAEDLTTMLIEAKLLKLTHLDLGGNRIAQLPNPFAFCSLPALQKLALNGNRLGEQFELNLNCTPFLQLLNLRDNQIKRLSNASIESLEQSSIMFHLELAGNPFACDCELRPTLDWLRSTKVWVVGSKQFHCQAGSYPPEYEGRPLLELDDQLLQHCASIGSAELNVLPAHSDRRYIALSYMMLSTIVASLTILLIAIAFVSRKSLRSSCSRAIQQVLQKRQYAPLDKQRVRGESAENAEAGEASGDLSGNPTVDENVV